MSPSVTPALKRYIHEKNILVKLAIQWPLTNRETDKKYKNPLTKILKITENKYNKNKNNQESKISMGHY